MMLRGVWAATAALAVAGCSSGGNSGPAAEPVLPGAPAQAAAAPAGADGLTAEQRAQIALPEPARCAVCHEDNVHTWRSSGHGRALQPIQEAEVFIPEGVHTSGAWPHRFELDRRADGTMRARLVDVDGEYAEYEVTHVLGGMERQMYIAPMGADGRPQMLPAEWGKKLGRLRHQNVVPPGDPSFWRTTDRAFTWDCIRCHSPRTQVDYDPDAGAYTVDWGRRRDVGITCSACHGDCDEHVVSAHKRGPRAAPEEKPLPTATAQAELMSCSRCHAQTRPIDKFPRADEQFFDALNPILLDDRGYYYPNGRNFGEAGHSFLSWELADCFIKGDLRCTDCHSPHGGGTLEEKLSQALRSCADCHLDSKLPTPCRDHPKPAAGAPSGTGTAGSGASCLDCHMPRFVVANGHAHVTDHRIAVPDPVLTDKTGIPNACDTCHQTVAPDPAALRRTLAETWKADLAARPRHVQSWALDRAIKGDPKAFVELRDFLFDDTVPWPVAATAARLLGRDPDGGKATAVLVRAIREGRHPMIRSGSAYGLGFRGEPAAVEGLRAALGDARRVVRVMAAASLVVRRDTARLEEAVAEIQAVCDAVPDEYEMRKLLGYGRQVQGKLEQALAEYRRAEKINDADPRVQALIAGVQRAIAERDQGK
ncbi:MAG: ammonia-forming cytochrome c nitrite reductase subunit c552 [Planctomycetota bacterium]|jgi:predicted CxxxxCH...CXXCH cytochrome family protein